MLGNASQAGYAAANLFLESLAEHRRNRGLKALTVAWGALDEVGYLARNPALRALLEAGAGVRGIAPAQALAVLEQLILADAGYACFAPFQWRRWRMNARCSALPKYAALDPGEEVKTGDDCHPLRQMLADLAPAEQRELVIRRLSEHLGRILGLASGDVDPMRPLSTMGLDSLTAAELHVAVESDTGLDLPLMRLIHEGSVAGIADLILRQECGK
jgi:acyl carrier protein